LSTSLALGAVQFNHAKAFRSIVLAVANLEQRESMCILSTIDDGVPTERNPIASNSLLRNTMTPDDVVAMPTHALQVSTTSCTLDAIDA
jgi:hypothetical protein